MSNATTNQPKAEQAPRGPRERSTMWAAIEVLRGKRKPMTAGEIYAEISERKLAPGLKGKTPEQTVAAQLAVHAKRGLYVERVEPGEFRLKRGRVGEAGSALTLGWRRRGLRETVADDLAGDAD